jgi:hypothetical protein
MYGWQKVSGKLRQAILRPCREAPWMVWHFPEPLLAPVIKSQIFVISKGYHIVTTSIIPHITFRDFRLRTMMLMRTALFWGITQCQMVILY